MGLWRAADVTAADITVVFLELGELVADCLQVLDPCSHQICISLHANEETCEFPVASHSILLELRRTIKELIARLSLDNKA